MHVRGNALETPTWCSPSASSVLDNHFQGPVRLPSMGGTPAAQPVKNQAHYPPSLPNQVLLLILSKFVSCQFPFLQKTPIRFSNTWPLPLHQVRLIPMLQRVQKFNPHWLHPVGKGVRQGCILSSCLFNFYAEYRMRTLGWKKHKLE